MTVIRHAFRLVTSLGVVFALSTVTTDAGAVPIYFDGSTSTDFNDPTNWELNTTPGANLDDIYSIDDGLSSTFSGGSTTVTGAESRIRCQRAFIGETHFGRLTMTGGALEVIGTNTLVVGRENQS